MTSFSVSVAVPLAVPLAGSGRMLGREGARLCFRLGLELDSGEPRAPPHFGSTPLLHVRCRVLPAKRVPAGEPGRPVLWS